MASNLKEYAPVPRKGPVRKYPSDKWFDGSWWLIEGGIDFDCTRTSMCHILRRHARSSGKKLEIHIEGEKDLAVRAFPIDDTQVKTKAKTKRRGHNG